MNQSLVLVTGNRGEAAEFQRLLGVEIEPIKIPLPEVQSLDVSEVARVKAEAAYEQLGRPVFVDDSGIEFVAWNGLPGALTSWFMDTVGNEGLIRMLDGFDDRSALVITALGYCSAHGTQVVTGSAAGSISTEVRGENGFGYDPIFVPEGYEVTFAEMTDLQKDGISMRGKAAQELAKVLGLT